MYNVIEKEKHDIEGNRGQRMQRIEWLDVSIDQTHKKNNTVYSSKQTQYQWNEKEVEEAEKTNSIEDERIKKKFRVVQPKNLHEIQRFEEKKNFNNYLIPFKIYYQHKYV